MAYKELEFDEKNIKKIQEWLCLNNYSVVIDSILGPATKAAIRRFRNDGKDLIDQELWNRLTFSMAITTRQEKYEGYLNIGQCLAFKARNHADAKAREIGGQNCGPWVRLYTHGFEGVDYPWCAGFVSFVLKYCYGLMNCASPLSYTLSCDNLAEEAKSKNFFRKDYDMTSIKQGDIFLIHNRANINDYVHTGIVYETGPDYIITVEGNSNDDGNREGYKVCRQTRNPFNNMNFISLG
jgi:hypothetical protein